MHPTLAASPVEGWKLSVTPSPVVTWELPSLTNCILGVGVPVDTHLFGSGKRCERGL